MATESSKMNANGAHDKGHEQEENDPAAIRAEIQATREDLAETVSAIQERLNPQRLREEARVSVRRATIGRVENAADDASEKVKGVGNDVFETIKRNPAPAVLAAVGSGLVVHGEPEPLERPGDGALRATPRRGRPLLLRRRPVRSRWARLRLHVRRVWAAIVCLGSLSSETTAIKAKPCMSAPGRPSVRPASKVQDVAGQAGRWVQEAPGRTRREGTLRGQVSRLGSARRPAGSVPGAVSGRASRQPLRRDDAGKSAHGGRGRGRPGRDRRFRIPGYRKGK